MRDLGIIPHIATEYKCSQIFKFFVLCKKNQKDLPEEVMIVENFQKAMYILFSTTLEEETEIKSKVAFIIKWIKEHAKDKLAGTHATREHFRLKYTNEFLAR